MPSVNPPLARAERGTPAPLAPGFSRLIASEFYGRIEDLNPKDCLDLLETIYALDKDMVELSRRIAQQTLELTQPMGFHQGLRAQVHLEETKKQYQNKAARLSENIRFFDDACKYMLRALPNEGAIRDAERQAARVRDGDTSGGWASLYGRRNFGDFLRQAQNAVRDAPRAGADAVRDAPRAGADAGKALILWMLKGAAEGFAQRG